MAYEFGVNLPHCGGSMMAAGRPESAAGVRRTWLASTGRPHAKFFQKRQEK
jgi:hypothetical protein